MGQNASKFPQSWRENARILDRDTFLINESMSGTVPFIIAKRTSAFIRVALLMETHMNIVGQLVKAYGTVRRDDWEFKSDSEDEDSDSEAEALSRTRRAPVAAVEGPGDRPPDVEHGIPAAQTDGALRDRDRDSVRKRGLAAGSHNHQGLDTGTWETAADAATGGASVAVQITETFQPAPSVIVSSVESSAFMHPLSGSHDDAADDDGDDDDGTDSWCIVHKVEVWNAFKSYMTMKEMDMSLIRAIHDGSLTISIPALDVNQRDVIVRDRMNAWYQEYGTNTWAYNIAVDTFLARTAAYLEDAKRRQDPETRELRGLLSAIDGFRIRLLPRHDADLRDVPQ